MLVSNSAPSLSGAPNFRDIGGYRAAGGLSVRHRRIFRSDRLSSLTPADLGVIRGLGIRAVCDLRSVSERALHPNRWPQGHAVDDFHCNILTDVRAANGSVFEPLRAEPTAAGARRMMTGIYRAMPHAFGPHFGQLFERITGDGLPLLIHCTAGKDRTGFAVAILLSVLGVQRGTINDDYLLTEKHNSHEERIAYVSELVDSQLGPQLGAAAHGDIVKIIVGVDTAYLDAAFAVIEAAHGSVEEYLRAACGVGRDRLLQVKDILLE